MKLAIATAAALLAASSFAFAADNNGGGNDNSNNKSDGMTTGSVTRDGTGDLEDQKDCREGTGGGAPCQEIGTEVK